MAKISANLGFLWKEIPLAEAIIKAKKHGFDAVECHWPYQQNVNEVQSALAETGLRLLGINTVLGSKPGDSGLCALPERVSEARASIEQAIDYAATVGTPKIHVMAGMVQGNEAQKTFVENLKYASKLAQPHGLTLLIEPLNSYDKSGYFLTSSKHAEQLIKLVSCDNVKIMYDCYHMQLMEGNLERRIGEILPLIGHIQIASVPHRAEPNTGEIRYEYLIPAIKKLGYNGYFGAEYLPAGSVEDNLKWLPEFQKL